MVNTRKDSLYVLLTPTGSLNLCHLSFPHFYAYVIETAAQMPKCTLLIRLEKTVLIKGKIPLDINLRGQIWALNETAEISRYISRGLRTHSHSTC